MKNLFLIFFGVGAVAYWQRKRIASYIAARAAEKAKSAASSVVDAVTSHI